jgi:Common central domain of tyrosinase
VVAIIPTLYSSATTAHRIDAFTGIADDSVCGGTTHRFSNNVSSGADGTSSIEAPHNTLHLAVGGFDMRVPGDPESAGWGVAGANGDMGENETAGFDPIFFFHHCNIDRVFWLWQQRHGQTERLDIDPTGNSSIVCLLWCTGN